MSDSTKRARVRKPAESPTPPQSPAEHLAALQAREMGKTIMYQVDAWGHVETRFVRSQNVAAWQAKGFVVR
ncbi:hypothetical protein [Hymenobacter crusticola]|uniref:Uncharacterized protein n=1 Tax=Hymenobacter crusticola TaxID=1770526 RepID=A0A243WEX3_9BACT|nr:hypothetical protein [Hymenobacter crusticola]OUJ73436.1 hypothetical protein BXP70_13565 [Hymenobacter crusticola]